MSKSNNPILAFKDAAMNYQSQIAIKGGGDKDLSAKIAKLQLKLAAAINKHDMKGMLKTQDQLECLGYSSEDCCGNGLGVW